MKLSRCFLFITAVVLVSSLPAYALSFHTGSTAEWRTAVRYAQTTSALYENDLQGQVDYALIDRESDTYFERQTRAEIRTLLPELHRKLAVMKQYAQEKTQARQASRAENDRIVRGFNQGQGLSLAWIPLVYNDIVETGSPGSLMNLARDAQSTFEVLRSYLRSLKAAQQIKAESSTRLEKGHLSSTPSDIEALRVPELPAEVPR